MNKGLKVFLIVAGVLFLLLIILALLIYFVIPIKIATLCISNDLETTGLSCSSGEDCKSEIIQESDLQNLPNSLREEVDVILRKTVYCEDVCKIKKIQVVSVIANQEIGGFEKVDVCNGEEVKLSATISEILKTVNSMN